MDKLTAMRLMYLPRLQACVLLKKLASSYGLAWSALDFQTIKRAGI